MVLGEKSELVNVSPPIKCLESHWMGILATVGINCEQIRWTSWHVISYGLESNVRQAFSGEGYHL